MDLKKVITGAAATITAVVGLFGAVIGFDARYAKEEDFMSSKQELLQTIEAAQRQIVDEMRAEVVKNRSVMIEGMQREADDLEYQMMELEKASKPVPRYMVEKHKQILRQIEALKHDEKDSN